MNKKGYIGDAAFVITVLFVLGVVSVVSYSIFTDLNTQFQAKDDLSNQSKSILSDNLARFAPIFDGIVAMGVALLGVALVVSTAAIGTRPEYFFLVIIVGMLLVGAVAMLSNVWAEFTSTTLATAASDFTFTNLLFDNYPYVALSLLGLLMVGLFVKVRS